MEITALDPTQSTSPAGVGAVRSQTSPGASGSQAAKAKGTGDTVELSEDAKAELAKLKARDAAVRAHEAAHMAAAGGLAKGGATFTYQKGPDGQNYAVGGEVSIDTSVSSDNPTANLAKARQIRAAALAPADPSPQDQKVAAQATQMESQAASAMAKKVQATTTRTPTAAYQATSPKPNAQPPRGIDMYA